MKSNSLTDSGIKKDFGGEILERFGCIQGSGDWDKPYQWLVKGLIPDRSVGFIGGPSASGKTFAVIEIMGAIISGRSAFGRFELQRPGAVIYCAVEGRQGIAHRFEAYRKSRGIASEQWGNLVQTIELFRFNDTKPEDFVEYISIVGGQLGTNVELVVFDTFRTFSGIGDENVSSDAQHAISWMRRVAHKAECAALAIHHSGKNTDNPIRPGDDFNRVLRGSSDFGGSAEFVIGVTMAESQEGEAMPWIWPAKLKDVKTTPPIAAPIVSYPLAISDEEPIEVGVIAAAIDDTIELSERALNQGPGQPSKVSKDARLAAEFAKKGSAPATIQCMRNYLNQQLKQEVPNDSTRSGRVRKGIKELQKNPADYEVEWVKKDELWKKTN